MKRPITIAGGGLAGLSLGIMLRREGVPVVLVEAANYPRHRVCGEFISGIAEEELAYLGIADLFANACRHHSTAWCEDGRVCFQGKLPSPAYGLSRYALDAAMARRFEELGGELRCGARHEADGEGLVWAAGRPKSDGGWIGLKAHFADVELSADLEIHLQDGSYVGLTSVEDGKVNVCGLFRGSKARPTVAAECAARGMHDVARRLAAARPVPGSNKGVSHFSLGWQKREGVCVGDAAVMIPPFTGNGMTMALQSGMAAAKPLAEWARGCLSWADAATQVRQLHQHLFQRRIRWALVMQAMLMRRPLRRIAFGVLNSGLLSFATLYQKVR